MCCVTASSRSSSHRKQLSVLTFKQLQMYSTAWLSCYQPDRQQTCLSCCATTVAKKLLVVLIVRQFICYSVGSCFAPQRPKAEEVAIVVYSLANLPVAKRSAQQLATLCGHFPQWMQSQVTQRQPNAQNIATLTSGLQQLKHVPSPVLAAAMLNIMFDMCQTKGQQPTSRGASNFLSAYAQLRLALTHKQANTLLTYLLTHDFSQTRVISLLTTSVKPECCEHCIEFGCMWSFTV